eukprot:4988022-Amphidinium_carterae.1
MQMHRTMQGLTDRMSITQAEPAPSSELTLFELGTIGLTSFSTIAVEGGTAVGGTTLAIPNTLSFLSASLTAMSVIVVLMAVTTLASTHKVPAKPAREHYQESHPTVEC